MTKIITQGSFPVFINGATLGVMAPLYGPLIHQFSVFYILPSESLVSYCEDGCYVEPNFFLTPPANPTIEIRWIGIIQSPVSKYRIYKSIAQESTYESMSELELVAEFGNDVFSFIDPNGSAEDYYTISTLVPDAEGNDVEGPTATLFKPANYVPAVCRIEGRIIDLRGNPIADVRISAKLVTPPSITALGQVIMDKEIHTLSAEDGFFSLAAIKGSKVILEINKARVSDPIAVPDLDMVVYTDLDIYEEYRFQDV